MNGNLGVLQISLFGSFNIVHPNWPDENRLTRTSQVLLAYLLLQRFRPQPREILASLLWGEKSQRQARNCLNTALWRLRGILEPEGVPSGTYLLAAGSGDVSFNFASRYWLDVQVFEEELHAALPSRYIHPSRQEATAPMPREEDEDVITHYLEGALRLYKGDLLEGFYDDWAVRERERLRSLYLKGLACLMQEFKARGELERSLTYGQQILSIDPLREEVHRELMRLYVKNGQRALAIRQYELCRELLAAELDIPPMQETQLLCQRILMGTDPVANLEDTDPRPNLAVTLQELRQALHAYDQARDRLETAIQQVEKSLG